MGNKQKPVKRGKLCSYKASAARMNDRKKAAMRLNKMMKESYGSKDSQIEEIPREKGLFAKKEASKEKLADKHTSETNSEPPQPLEPTASIYLFQPQNSEIQTELTTIEIKKENPIDFIPSSEPDLNLEIECEQKILKHQPNLVIETTTDVPSDTGVRRSKRMKAVQNQEGIQTIQINNQNHTDDKMGQNEEDIEPEHKLNRQEQELQDAVKSVIKLAESEACKADLANQKEPEDIDISGENGLHSDHDGEENIEKNDLLVESTKRKRGRPRKPVDEKSVPVVTEKRKRGRPRKIPQVVNTNTNEAGSAKRKRGRPRKFREDENVTAEVPIAENNEDEESEGEYTVYISEEVMDDPIHLDIQGVISYLV